MTCTGAVSVSNCPPTKFCRGSKFRVFARNANGWAAELSTYFDVRAVPDWLPDEELVSFPRVVDGRIDRFVQRDGYLEVGGWALNREEFRNCRSIFAVVNRQLVPVSHVEPVVREDIARSVDNSNVRQCGFVGRVDSVDFARISSFVARADDGKLYELPLARSHTPARIRPEIGEFLASGFQLPLGPAEGRGSTDSSISEVASTPDSGHLVSILMAKGDDSIDCVAQSFVHRATRPVIGWRCTANCLGDCVRTICAFAWANAIEAVQFEGGNRKYEMRRNSAAGHQNSPAKVSFCWSRC